MPYADFLKSAQCLDYRRLGKQRCEAWQVYLALTKENYGWKSHPCSKMWKGYELALLYYGFIISCEWKSCGFKDTMAQRFCDEFNKNINPFHTQCIDDGNGHYRMEPVCDNRMQLPPWIGNKKFHSAMRSNLLRKNYDHYKQFKWKEKDNLPYFWLV